MASIIEHPNSIWPNGLKIDSENYVTFYPLGTNKVDISTVTWPDGDKLVSPYVYKNGKLVGFVDTGAITVSGSATTTMNYSHIEADFSSIVQGTLTVDAPNAIVKKFRWSVVLGTKYLGCKTIDEVKAVDSNYKKNDIVNGVWNESLSSLTDGLGMFYTCNTLTTFNSDLSSLTDGSSMLRDCPNLTTFNADLSSLTEGGNMFYVCTNLTTFNSDLSSLISGRSMFGGCGNLTTFTTDLSSLSDGGNMFNGCTNLTTFSSDLSSLAEGKQMFRNCSNLTTFTSDLSSLTNGNSMFYECSNLTTFTSDLSSLSDGSSMFQYCTNLTSFTSDLSSLTKSGSYMFFNCKLDAPSVKNIIDTINTYSGKLTLGMGCNNTTADKNLFAQEAGYTDMTSLLAAFQAKKWTVTTQYNGRPTTTYSLRRPSEDTLPVFVKLEETEDHADYTLEDGSKKFRLDWFHETTDSTDGYDQFNTLEEAIDHFNIKPIERN